MQRSTVGQQGGHPAKRVDTCLESPNVPDHIPETDHVVEGLIGKLEFLDGYRENARTQLPAQGRHGVAWFDHDQPLEGGPVGQSLCPDSVPGAHIEQARPGQPRGDQLVDAPEICTAPLGVFTKVRCEVVIEPVD